MAVSNTFSVSVTGSAPAWFTSLANKQWATPLSNWLGASGVKDPLADVTNGTHSGIIEEWTGMGADADNKTIFMLANGGHNRYYGNEVYSCDLSSASPAWTRRRDATQHPGITSADFENWSDGRPASSHSTNVTVAGGGRWFLCGMPSVNYNGGSRYRRWWEFKPFSGSGTISGSANDWVDLGSTGRPAGLNGNLSVRGCAVYDPVDQQLIAVNGNNVSPSIVYYNLSGSLTGSPTLENSNAIAFNTNESAAVDTTNHILLMRSLAVGGAQMYRWVSLASNATKTGTINSVSFSGTHPSTNTQFYWHAPSQAFITWDFAGGFRKLTPTVIGGAYTGGSWTQVSGAGGPTPSDATGDKMYNKIQYIPDMGNGDAALIVVPRYASPDTYVMRLSGDV